MPDEISGHIMANAIPVCLLFSLTDDTMYCTVLLPNIPFFFLFVCCIGYKFQSQTIAQCCENIPEYPNTNRRTPEHSDTFVHCPSRNLSPDAACSTKRADPILYKKIYPSRKMPPCASKTWTFSSDTA